MSAAPPPSPVVAAARARLRDLVGREDSAMERHCVRVGEIARELGARAGEPIDEDVLGVAAYLHDAGLYLDARGGAYVTDGRRLVDEVCAPHGLDGERRRRCADAVEQHHAPTSRRHLGPEVELLRRADLVDLLPGQPVRFGLERAWLRAQRRRLPATGFLRHVSLRLTRDLVGLGPRALVGVFRPPTRGA